MKKILVLLVILFLFPLNIFSQEDITVEQLVGNGSEIEELEKKEEERSQEKANMLGFVLPEYTDNPSYVITFTDPSPEGDGVEIEIDGKDFVKISSPYSFPALNIGTHDIRFRFLDENGYVQLLEYEFLVIPRPPIVNTPEITDTSVTIGGTSLPNSEIIYSLSANSYNLKDIVKADANGNWIVQVDFENGLSQGIYTFISYTRKYGYSSNFSEPTTFAAGDIANDLEKQEKENIFFSFSSISKDNIGDILKTNSDLIFLVLIPFVLGIGLAVLIKGILDSRKKDRSARETEKLLSPKTTTQEKTLRELFQDNTEEENLEQEVKEKKEKGKKPKKEKRERNESKKEPTIVNKDVFLKTYKHVDPDTQSGKEKDSKDVKEKIKISLTSKKEE